MADGQDDDGVGAIILASGIIGFLGGVALGLLQPLFIVGIGAGIYGGPSWSGLVFLLSLSVVLVSGLLALFAGHRDVTLPAFALGAGLAFGLVAGNWIARTLGIGFAA
jgi:hypothetical protein